MDFGTFSYLIFIAATFLSTTFPEGLCIKNVQIKVPEFILSGEDAKIICNYEMENDLIYAVKWYKGSKEFFRYIPKEVPSKRSFSLPGIQVDVLQSKENEIVLRNVTLELSGQIIRCIVSAESHFQTLESNAQLVVVVVGRPNERPILEFDRRTREYYPGERIGLSCKSAFPSYPATILTLYLDDEEVKPEKITIKTEKNYSKSPNVPGLLPSSSLAEESLQLKTTIANLTFDLPVNLTPVKVRCRAQVSRAYDQSFITTIQPIPRTLSGPDTLHTRSSGSSSIKIRSESSLNQLLLLLLFCSLFSFPFCSNSRAICGYFTIFPNFLKFSKYK